MMIGQFYVYTAIGIARLAIPSAYPEAKRPLPSYHAYFITEGRLSWHLRLETIYL
jgi:hypothetical protein